MNKHLFVLPLAAATLALSVASTAALAADQAKPETITCEEFLTLDDDVQPGVVYWLNGKSGEEYDTPVTYVITECQQEKQATVWQTVKQYIEKMKQHMEPTKKAAAPAKP